MQAVIPALVLSFAAAACNSAPSVVPFPDAGNPCGQGMNIDCGEFAGTTCVGPSTGGCERMTYGCSADASFFTSVDTSMCPPEAGPEAASEGDSSLIHGSDGGMDGARE